MARQELGGPPFKLVAALDENGGCPFVDFLNGISDTKHRAQILSKLEFLAELHPEDRVRPWVGEIEGPIKELRPTYYRILFATDDRGTCLLICGGERKHNDDKMSPTLIARAKALREAWLAGREGEDLDIKAVRKLVQRNRIKWPT